MDTRGRVMTESRRQSRRRVWGAILVVLAALYFVATAVLPRTHPFNRKVDIQVPAPPELPKPNAYDFFAAARKALVDDGKTIGAALPSGPPTNHNTPELTWAEKAELVRRNSKALKILRQGFGCRYLNPPSRTFAGMSPKLSELRHLCRLLAVEGNVAAHRADYGRAMNSYIDACQAGSMIPHGAPLVDSLVGVAIEAIGRKSLYEVVDKVDAESARRGARRMEIVIGNHVPYSKTLTEEKYTFASGLAEFFNRAEPRDAMLPGATFRNPVGTLTKLRIDTENRRRMLRDYIKYTDQSIAVARKPYSKYAVWPGAPSDSAVAILIPAFEQGYFKIESKRAADGLLCIQLALRAYKLEHGKYPQTLQALLPGYVSALPADPFALSGTFQYHQKPGGYVLYSIGPDGKDDEGKPGDPSGPTPSASVRANRIMDADSKGDIVAGANKM